MKVLVIGSGGREHAIIYKLKKDKRIKEVFCARGNAGISKIATLVDIDENDTKSLIDFVKKENIDLTIVGPEVPLVNGIVDEFEKENLKIFGPNKECAKLEGSKSFCKDFLVRHNINTAKYKEYTDVNLAIKEIDGFGYPVVIKADGLCGGKGVLICKNRQEAIQGLKEIMDNKVFKTAGDKVVVEEFLEGIEMSVLAFVDNNSIVPMVSAKDHKKVFNGEKGLNTGGMGTFSPSDIYTENLEKRIKINILDKTLEGFKKDNLNFKGVLFVGLMVNDGVPKVLEFNTRFGDPETQVVLTRLETELVDIIEAILNNSLDKIDIKYTKKECVCVILSSWGYPEKYEIEKEIYGLENLDDDIVVYHSGTKLKDGKLVTNGGRVLGITCLDSSVEVASNKVYENIKKINFENMHFRTDIGR